MNWLAIRARIAAGCGWSWDTIGRLTLRQLRALQAQWETAPPLNEVAAALVRGFDWMDLPTESDMPAPAPIHPAVVRQTVVAAPPEPEPEPVDIDCTDPAVQARLARAFGLIGFQVG